MTAVTAHNDYLNRRFFGDLDGLRALSVLGVIYFHCKMSFSAFQHREFLGVDMFFVISGFLIVTLILREKAKHGDFNLKQFYMRRVLRIFPIYYSIILGLALVFFFVDRDGKFMNALPWYLTFTINFYATPGIMFVAWSLATEEQFYLIWPWVEKLKAWQGRIYLLIALIAANQLVNFGFLDSYFHSIGWKRETHFILDATFTPILLGVGCAYLLMTDKGFSFAWQTLKLGLPAMPVVLAVILVGLINIPSETFQGWHRLAVHVVMSLWLVSLVIGERNWLSVFLRLPFIQRIGAVSYGMYLFHFLVIVFLRALDRKGLIPGEWALLFGAVVLTWIIAEISFRFLETPFLNMRRHFRHG